jgi:NAD(P)-dependent dehydrogenase (short-subunit alcohol dehydrogenase family)
MGRLKGQVVIVTGASSGLGEASARMLAGKGASLVLAARRGQRLQALAAQIAAAGAHTLPVAADVRSPEGRERLVRETMSAFGRIDALVNNAGYGQRGPVETVPVEAIRSNFETNVFSLVALSQLVIPIMRRQGGGRIVNMGSVAGRIARPYSTVYDATKHALEALSDGMRFELAQFGIKVVLIEPGFILTEFTEAAERASQNLMEGPGQYAEAMRRGAQAMQRWTMFAGKPDHIARLVVKALAAPRPKARYAAPGHAKLALAMKRCLPSRLFDFIISR